MCASAVLVAALPVFLAARAEPVPSVRLNNGVEMPIMAFGANIWDAETCRKTTADALSVGFRNIWSSELVGAACQRAQAEAIKASGLPRSELFVAGTVNTKPCRGREGCYEATKRQSEAQFEVLGEAALDMLMLDYPPTSAGCEPILGQWQAFEELYAAGRVRTIAVSNFSPKQLECITAAPGATVPAANQLPFMVGHGSDTIVEDNAKYGVNVQAYTPLANGKLARSTLCKAIGRRHKKTAAQVALRWLVQRNATVCVQSTARSHLQEDVEIFDFELTEEDMEQLDAIGGGQKYRAHRERPERPESPEL
mmetsp:Transcript_112138/g.348041  ORF Transcript_112138/g.348041 Transcript_112138/m.348041 type:complete len:310 (-) Transcript_112138:15-944(-)